MKITRYKKVQRYLTFYSNNYGFRKPFQVLLDGTFCQFALKNKVNLKEQLLKYLNGEVKFFTTVCCVTEMEKIGPLVFGAMLILKQFNVKKCGHEKNPIGASECLLSTIKSDPDDHCFIATQDPWLTKEIRSIPGCPLLYLKCSALVLEKPSGISETEATTKLKESVSIQDHQMETIKQLKEEQLPKEEQKRGKKRKKGPNPLSCKPKKKSKPNESKPSSSSTASSTESKKSKKRKRTKIPKHIRKLLKENNVDCD